MDDRYFSDKLVEWYKKNKRDLPWRETNDPYKVWLSEIILQQTRVNQGLPYYTRARNLHKCAKVVVSEYHGSFPTDFKTLLKLPGIGEYTAAAIASFSFREPVAVVDGNVFRVLSRIFGIENEINSIEGKKIFTKLANDLISKESPDFHNQA